MPLPILAALGGGLFSGLFGQSSNRAAAENSRKSLERALEQASRGYDTLRENPLSMMAQGYGGDALMRQAQALGLEGGSGFDEAYNRFTTLPAYRQRLQEGREAITGSAAARGLLGSGATGRALTRYGQNLAGQQYDNYISRLGGVAGNGLEMAGLLAQLAQSAGLTGAQAIQNTGRDVNSYDLAGSRALEQGIGTVFGGLSPFASQRGGLFS